jgi:hypothetical protein
VSHTGHPDPLSTYTVDRRVPAQSALIETLPRRLGYTIIQQARVGA